MNIDCESVRIQSFAGTIDYMSPEAIHGTSWENECDLWALGIIIFRFFAEYFPFKGEYEDETMQKIEEDPIEFPDDFPVAAKDLCSRLLDKDPAKRLGWGRPGSVNDMSSLKSHPFFDGIDFDNLIYCKSPVPISDVVRSSVKRQIIEKYKRLDVDGKLVLRSKLFTISKIMLIHCLKFTHIIIPLINY